MPLEFGSVDAYYVSIAPKKLWPLRAMRQKSFIEFNYPNGTRKRLQKWDGSSQELNRDESSVNKFTFISSDGATGAKML